MHALENSSKHIFTLTDMEYGLATTAPKGLGGSLPKAPFQPPLQAINVGEHYRDHQKASRVIGWVKLSDFDF